MGDTGLNETLTKRLSTGPNAPAPTVAPELFPCLVLEGDRPENSYTRGEWRFMRTTSAAAGGAATRSSVQLVNRSKNSLATVELLSATTLASVKIVFYGPDILPFGTASNGVVRDGRIRSGAGSFYGSQCVVVSDNTLGLAGGNAGAIISASVPCEAAFVLGPGTALYVSAPADNIALDNVTFYWRERLAQPGELV